MRFKHYLSTISHNQIVAEKLSVIKFFDEYRYKTTKDAFGVGRSTVYLWKKKLKDSKQDVACLANRSRRPKGARKGQADPLILKFIRDIRENTYRMGKTKIKLLLDEYCRQNRLPVMSESWIGKQIKKNNWYFEPVGKTYHNPSAIHPKRKTNKARVVKGEMMLRPGQQVQIDTITRFDLNVKRYIVTAVDLYSRFAFAYTYKSLSSKIALDFYQKLEIVAPFKVQAVKTDNGLEFEGHFDSHLKQNNITHFFSYPRTPKSNAFVERFNRTIQEEFVDRNISMIENPQTFNSKLIDYLVFFNSVRPHRSLDNLTPMGYLVFKGILSNMSVTHTCL
jgi:transposase InsO family protein